MPGLSLLAHRSVLTPLLKGRGQYVRRKMLHFQSYTARTVVEDDFIDFGFTSYPGYPVKMFTHTDYSLLLEGRIYNYDAPFIENGLRELAEAFIRSESVPMEALKRFLLDADGEFVVAIYDKAKNRILVVNDFLGRLPLYYYRDNAMFAISREMKFILPFLPSLTANKTAFMEYLLYGYPLKDNTLIENVRYFPSATCIIYDMRTGQCAMEPYQVLNLDAPGNKNSRPQIIADMRKLFLEALFNRTRGLDPDKIIVSLSGGLDSRGVLAGLMHLGFRPVAVTAQSAEEPSARAVAKALGAEVYPIAQGVPRGTLGFADIVFLKDGLDCHPDLAQLYYNLQDLHDRFGENAVYFTGIYGGEITRHSHPTSGLPSIDALARYLMKAQDRCRYSTEKVLGLFHSTKRFLIEHLAQRLLAFPERDVYKKYLRFRHESNLRFVGEAEDRNRYYLWTISPYFALPFFRYAMGIDENRKDVGLFRDFLFSINPLATRVPYYDYRLPLDNPILLRGVSLVQRAVRHVAVKNALREILRWMGVLKHLVFFWKNQDKAKRDALKTTLMGLVKQSEMAGQCFDRNELLALIRRENDIQGLERLQIVIVYLNGAVQWHLTPRSPLS